MNTQEKIKSYQKFGSRLGLERIAKLTDLLGKPQEDLRYIHVGGTNGKGSVSKYIYSVLRANGYSVGMFTSPFMEGFRHAIIVDDKPMDPNELDLNYKKIDDAVESMKKKGFESPTEFEIITSLALLYFRYKKPDFVIMEVGLGGIGDSTNIIGSPLLSVITSVSLDHCDVLGDTIEEIAKEKAGIIKENVPVISNVRDPIASKIIAREAYKKNAPLINATKHKVSVLKKSIEASKFTVKIDGIFYHEMEITMAGQHQIRNAVCALTVIEQLRRKALISLDKEKTVNSLKESILAGRFEIITGDPPIIMDGAHNIEGAKALSDTIEGYFPDKKILTVFTLMKDKKADDVIKELKRFSEEMIVADILKDKPVNSDELLSSTGSVKSRLISDRNELIKVIKESKQYDIILITGSLYLIRDLRPDLLNRDGI